MYSEFRRALYRGQEDTARGSEGNSASVKRVQDREVRKLQYKESAWQYRGS